MRDYAHPFFCIWAKAKMRHIAAKLHLKVRSSAGDDMEFRKHLRHRLHRRGESRCDHHRVLIEFELLTAGVKSFATSRC